MGLAELQHGLRVVVDVVDAHFLHDSKSSLSRMGGKEGRWLRKTAVDVEGDLEAETCSPLWACCDLLCYKYTWL